VEYRWDNYRISKEHPKTGEKEMIQQLQTFALFYLLNVQKKPLIQISINGFLMDKIISDRLQHDF